MAADMRTSAERFSGAYYWVQSKILNHLRLIEGTMIATRDLIPVVWENPDAEPDEPQKVIRTAVFALRSRGIPIVTSGWRGYKFKAILPPETRLWDLLANGQQDSRRLFAKTSGRSGEDRTPTGRRGDLAA